MYWQGEFDFGIPVPPRRPKLPDRAFFGLFLQPRFCNRFADLQEQLCHKHGIVGSRLSVERLHLSLQHAGDYRRLRSKIIFAASRSGRNVHACL
jgi:2'-5' RNA ligase